MKCRPKLCQRLAAQLTNTPPTPPANGSIWITDEVLSDAFNRYVRVSHASRRFGSHVPGPLEARRRASKRRMGCAVVGTSMAPPGGDFGALFGAGGTDVSGQGWSWKPPGSQLDQSLPDKKPSSPWMWSQAPPKPPSEWDQVLDVPRSEEDFIEASIEGFEDLLCHSEDEEHIDSAVMQPIIDFLASSSNELKAHNTSRLVKWLVKRDADPTAWQAITDAICDKIQLGTIEEDELIEVIQALPQARTWEQHQNAFQQLHQSYVSFWTSLDGQGSSESPIQQALFKMMAKTTRDLQGCFDLIELVSKAAASVQHGNILSTNIFATLQAISEHKDEDTQDLLSRLALSLDNIPSHMRKEVLTHSTSHIINLREPNKSSKRRLAQMWLDCLKSTASFSHFSETMDAVYARLATHFNLSELAVHFKKLQSVEIVDILLRVWLPITDFKTYGRTENRASRSDKEFKLLQPHLKEASPTHLPEISRIFWASHIEKKAKQKSCTWETLLRAYSRVHVCYDAVASEILAISQAIHSPNRVYGIFIRLLKSPQLAIPTSTATATVKFFLDKQLPRLALAVFRATPSIGITDVPGLPVSLSKHGRYRTGDIMELMLRQPEKVPMEQRALPKLDLSQEHIDTVHIIAHDTAHATSLNPRSAFRHVWAYYRSLQDRGAPLHALMSRAMVHAGILRPISEHIWVPDERLDYILDIVERIEGYEMREQVQDIALRMRSSVHEQVLTRRRVIEERSVWTKSTKELAGQTRFRLKKWAKKAPLPTCTGNASYYVPEDEITTSNPDSNDWSLLTNDGSNGQQ